MREKNKWTLSDWCQWWGYLFRTKRLFPKIIFSEEEMGDGCAYRYAGLYSPYGGPGPRITIYRGLSFKAKVGTLIHELGHWGIDTVLTQRRPLVRIFNPKVKKYHLKWDFLWQPLEWRLFEGNWGKEECKKRRGHE